MDFFVYTEQLGCPLFSKFEFCFLSPTVLHNMLKNYTFQISAKWVNIFIPPAH